MAFMMSPCHTFSHSLIPADHGHLERNPSDYFPHELHFLLITLLAHTHDMTPLLQEPSSRRQLVSDFPSRSVRRLDICLI